jgi:hypothetical protein
MASRTTICSPAEVLTYLGLGSTYTDAQRGLVEMLMPMVDDLIKSFLGWNVIQTTYTHLLPDVDMFDIYYGNFDLGIPFDAAGGRISYAFPGNPQILQVPEIPLRSVTSLYADYSSAGGQGPADFPAGSLLTEGTDYYIDFDSITSTPSGTTGVCWTGHVRRWIGSVWPARQRTAKITYVAGVTPDELDGVTSFPSRRIKEIKFAAIQACAAAYNQAKATAVNGLGAQGPIVSERLGDAAFQYAETAVMEMTGMMTELPFGIKRVLQPHARIKR